MDPAAYCDTGKTCLGGGMHCFSVSSYLFNCYYICQEGYVIVVVRLFVRLSVTVSNFEQKFPNGLA